MEHVGQRRRNMTLLNIILLAIVQGFAELLPVSSSAHVVIAEKLLRLDPSSPPMTLLLVMLHTGTMFAVIVYFWSQWRATYFASAPAFKRAALLVVVATVLTGIVGGALVKLIEKHALGAASGAEVEDLFSHLELIAPALAAAGVLILIAGLVERRRATQPRVESSDLSATQAGIIGAVQGLCLPFRGFSRSGATISMGMLLKVEKSRAEAFSFALAVILTPPVVAREAMRLAHWRQAGQAADLGPVALMSLLGALLAFGTGLLALRWLSRWLQGGRWYLFGVYCLVAAAVVGWMHQVGY
jgi:undecaprenyl-diphosphatase